MERAVQVRGVPDEVHRELRARAAAAGMSLSDYLLEELTRLASRPPVADVLARARDLHAPHLLDLEVTQVLRRLVAHGLLSVDRAADARADYADLGIVR